MDTSAILGFKQPDNTQQLSSLLGVAKGAQDLQNQGISLQERQAMQKVLSNPANYTDETGAFNLDKAQKAIMSVAPTTGAKYISDIATAHTNALNATKTLNALTSENRAQIGGVLASIPPDATQDLVHKSVEALDKQFGGRLGPLVNVFKNGYAQALKAGGQKGASEYVMQSARSVLPQETQQAMDTPAVAQVDNGQQVKGINVKPGVQGVPMGSEVLSVQKQLPPTTPTVGPNNQPGYVGPQAALPAAQSGVSGNFSGDPAKVMAAAQQIADPQERANALAAINEQAKRTPGFAGGANFVPSGPVPGANESKIGSVQVMNDHWAKLNAGSADNPVALSLLSTIRELAPGAITGTEAGKKAYWNGLFNALHLDTKPSGDLQRDTDLLNKAMAQLNLATPATTDAMRQIVEAGRPHSTMSGAAIKEASQQIEGQLKANMAMRNLLQPDKQFAGATGDNSHYEQKRQMLEQVMDPRVFQYESLPKSERAAFMSRLSRSDPEEAKRLIEKAQQLVKLGVIK